MEAAPAAVPDAAHDLVNFIHALRTERINLVRTAVVDVAVAILILAMAASVADGEAGAGIPWYYFLLCCARFVNCAGLFTCTLAPERAWRDYPYVVYWTRLLALATLGVSVVAIVYQVVAWDPCATPGAIHFVQGGAPCYSAYTVTARTVLLVLSVLCAALGAIELPLLSGYHAAVDELLAAVGDGVLQTRRVLCYLVKLTQAALATYQLYHLCVLGALLGVTWGVEHHPYLSGSLVGIGVVINTITQSAMWLLLWSGVFAPFWTSPARRDVSVWADIVLAVVTLVLTLSLVGTAFRLWAAQSCADLDEAGCAFRYTPGGTPGTLLSWSTAFVALALDVSSVYGVSLWWDAMLAAEGNPFASRAVLVPKANGYQRLPVPSAPAKQALPAATTAAAAGLVRRGGLRSVQTAS